jgi:hypothetical protein
MATPNKVANKARLMSTRRRVLRKNGNRMCDSSSEDRSYPLSENRKRHRLLKNKNFG